jgi:hypothetical protein
MRLTVPLLAALAASACGCCDSSDANRSGNIKVVELEHAEILSKGNADLIDSVY